MEKLYTTYGEKFRSSVVDPKTKKLGRHVVVFLNDRNILIQDYLDTKLKNGDSLLITPVAVGG